MEIQVRNELRPCTAMGERALLHFFFVHTWTHGASATIGGFPAGQENRPCALVEYEDGRIEAVSTDSVRMLDSAELFSEFDFGKGCDG